MTLVALGPLIAVALFAGLTLTIVLTDQTRAGLWRLPAALAAAFMVFSLITVAREGLFGFWANHTVNLWGNQVWYDLLLAFGASFALIVPRARAVGMTPLPWLILIFGTGCIGIYAMFARLLFLEEHGRAQGTAGGATA